MTEFNKKYHLRLPSCKQSIDLVPDYLGLIERDFSLSERVKADMLLTLTEAVNNAIIHGNCEDESKFVQIKLLQPDESVLSFQISDQGQGFDPDALPDPTHPDNIAEPGGRGVFLIKKVCDCVRFIDRGTTVEIEFNLECE